MCRFIWRGQEEAEGEIYFGEDNWISLTFLGGGKIRGVMHWEPLGTFEFVGKKVKEQSVEWVQNVASWKDEWRGMNDHNHGDVQWGGEPSPGEDYEGPYATPRSDTDSSTYSRRDSDGWSETSSS